MRWSNWYYFIILLEGHYIRGYGDRTTASEIYLLDGAKEQAEAYLKDNELAKNYLEQVSKLFYGFETPYGLELLSTVGWIMQTEPTKSLDRNFVVASVQNWNERKKRIFPIEHIEKVWLYLINEVQFIS